MILRNTSCCTPCTGLRALFWTCITVRNPFLLRSWSPDDGDIWKRSGHQNSVFGLTCFRSIYVFARNIRLAPLRTGQEVLIHWFLLGAKHSFSFQDLKSWYQTEGKVSQDIKVVDGPPGSRTAWSQSPPMSPQEWGLDGIYRQVLILSSTGILSYLRHVTLLLILRIVPFSGILSRRPRKVNGG